MAESPAGVIYADTSALVKLVVRESETDALEALLLKTRSVATSAITSVELLRAVARARSELRAGVANDWAVLALLAAAAEIPLTDEIRAAASALPPVGLRTLDAIHLASAMALEDELGGVLSYDERMRAAAATHGLALLAPA